MSTKKERFERWQGPKKTELHKIGNTIKLIEDYFSELNDFESLKSDFSCSSTIPYTSLGLYNERKYGSLVYCILSIEETLEALPLGAKNEKKLLNELIVILKLAYSNPKENTEQNSNTLIRIIHNLIENNEASSYLSYCINLHYVLYFILKVVFLEIDSLSIVTRSIVSYLISDINTIQKQIHNLLVEMENRPILFNRELLANLHQKMEHAVSRSLKQYFHERYQAAYLVDADENKRCMRLQRSLQLTTKEMEQLILLRKKKEKLRYHSQKVQDLESLLQNSDKKTFLELMNAERDNFHLMLEYALGEKKEKLIDTMELLRQIESTQSLSTKSTTRFGWGWGLFYLGSTSENSESTLLDSECRALLTELIAQFLFNSKNQCKEIDRQIKNIILQLAQGEFELKKLIKEASIECLSEFLEENRIQEQAIDKYVKIVFMLNRNTLILASFKQMHGIFVDFIQEHDDWLVRLSNFFSWFFPCFKSETAALIDKSREFLQKIDHFEIIYSEQLNKHKETVQNHPHLSQKIKEGFENELEAAKVFKSLEPNVHLSVSKKQVRGTIKAASSFFNEIDSSVMNQDPINLEFCFCIA